MGQTVFEHDTGHATVNNLDIVDDALHIGL